jgi:hypothetical protein
LDDSVDHSAGVNPVIKISLLVLRPFQQSAFLHVDGRAARIPQSSA